MNPCLSAQDGDVKLMVIGVHIKMTKNRRKKKFRFVARDRSIITRVHQ